MIYRDKDGGFLFCTVSDYQNFNAEQKRQIFNLFEKNKDIIYDDSFGDDKFTRYRNLCNLMEVNKNTFYIVFVKDQFAGCLWLDHLKFDKEFNIQVARLHVIIARKFWGDVVTSGAESILSFLFDKVKIHKLYAEIPPYNRPARMCLMRNGFELEGVLKSTICHNKLWYDTQIYGRLNNG